MGMGLQIPVKTCFGDFLYDGFTNQISMINSVSEAHSCYIGVYGKSRVERCYYRHHRLESMTLQLTRRCNLHCDYCVYSGNFTHMQSHADVSMDMTTIRKAIDFLEAHSRENKQVSISFYGGEPLLEFAKIKDAVAYAEKVMTDRSVEFGIASNGVLLNKTVARFLMDHPNVQMQITLNGNQHDRFRKTGSGDGSLQPILKNIEQLRNFYPKVWEKQIHFIANIASLYEVSSLRDFYHSEVGKLPDLITRIITDGCNTDLKQNFGYSRNEELRFEAKLRETYVKTDDPFLAKIFATQLRSIHERPILEESAGMAINPTCAPMAQKVFVRTDGSINICERVTDSVSFGNVYNGFKDSEIDELYDQAAEFVERNCMSCWAQHLCMLCFQQILDETGKIKGTMPEEWCMLSREHARMDIQSYIETMYSDPRRF